MGQSISMGIASPEAYEQVLLNTNCCFPNNMGSMKVTISQATITPIRGEAELHTATLELALILLPQGGFSPTNYNLEVIQKCRFRYFMHAERVTRLYKVELSEQVQQHGGVVEIQVPLPSDFHQSYKSSFCEIWTEMIIHFYDERNRYLKFVTKLEL